MPPPRYVAVCGASEATPSQLAAAREVGKLLAKEGAIVINGGYGGVTGAASEGAASEGGTVVGILPEVHRDGANPHLSVSIPTGLGQGRNLVIVTAADSVIAIGAGWGTLSEIALARRLGRWGCALGTWDLDGPVVGRSAAEAGRRRRGE